VHVSLPSNFYSDLRHKALQTQERDPPPYVAPLKTTISPFLRSCGDATLRYVHQAEPLHA